MLFAAVRATARAVYTSMYWIVKLTTHCIDVDTAPFRTLNFSPTSGIFSNCFAPSFGSWALRVCAPCAAAARRSTSAHAFHITAEVHAVVWTGSGYTRAPGFSQ